MPGTALLIQLIGCPLKLIICHNESEFCRLFFTFAFRILSERYYNWKVFYLTIVSLSKPCCHSSSAVYDFTCSSRCLFYLFQTTKMKKKNFVNKRPKLMVSFCFQFFPNICTRTIISSWFCQRIPGGQNDNESINKSFSHVWLKSR